MPARLKALLRKLGRLDQAFVVVLALAFAGNFLVPASMGELVLTVVAFLLAVVVAIKWLVVAVKKVIWRLRYRLLVAYLLIAVVPLVLVGILVWSSISVLGGQLATYLVTTELERTTSDMLTPARGLAWTPPASRLEHARWLAHVLWFRFPGIEIVMRDGTTSRLPEDSTLTPPPSGWSDASGLMRKDGRLCLWAHAVHGSSEVTIVVPVTRRILNNLVPHLGEMQVRRRVDAPENLPNGGAPPNPFPPQEGFPDREVSESILVPVAIWESPGKFEGDLLFLSTRYSALFRAISGQEAEHLKGETTVLTAWMSVFILVVAVFVIVELVSVVIGVRLTRTITRAVHNLYQGTQRIRAGDFSHRIEAHGNDQLAELSGSFNRMTEDLERLVEVAKEKERLQSEIEIAREVQNQLFPRCLPASNTLELAAMCVPARLVSGDYYDYMNLEAPQLAFAIGDVAGKGISAALLMATVQSTMRAQLRAGRDFAPAAGNGGHRLPLSAASLVSRLNQQLFAFTSPEKFATFYFALYDDVTGMLTYTNAGHLPPILVRNGDATRLDVTGTVIGAFSFSEYGESSLRLEPGDLLVGFTDGVTEPENEFGEMFGEDRLSELIVKHAARETGEIITAVMESVRQWTGSPELQDDMTLLLARRI
jgi:phosphoserine phosphatase RsbU/P